MNRGRLLKFFPLAMTACVLLALFLTAASLYPGFGTARVVVNLLSDNSVMGITALGMTFVILAGGIDLSVGAVAALSTVLIAAAVRYGMHPLLAIGGVVLLGTVYGWLQGWLIERYSAPAFLITLGGMFFARGVAFWASMQSLGIKHPFYTQLQDAMIPVPWAPKAFVSMTALLFLVLFAAAFFIAHYTVFGRNVYAVGGSAESARLMGLPVARTSAAVYGVSGFCAAMAGVAATIYTGSGNPAGSNGLELDAIAAVVIGGTLLTGGSGYVFGTLLGVLIFGTIHSALDFNGQLDSSWLRIAVGVLLLAFIVMQRLLTRGTGGAKAFA